MFGGRIYRWVTAQLEGTVAREDGSVGDYSVPITLNYPNVNSNGFGFVDVVNNADYVFYTSETAGLGRPTTYFTGDLIFSDFLRREGFIYISVQWYLAAAETYGTSYASIDRPTDGNEIIRDAARLLRSLDQFVVLESAISPAERVIAHGQSSSASLLRGFVWSGFNREVGGSSLIFDGLILTGTNGRRCSVLVDDRNDVVAGRLVRPSYSIGALDCPQLPDDGRIITLRTQTEAERQGNLTGTSRNERWYDVAGVAHIPEPMGPLMSMGAHQQNPISWNPVAKALLSHLVAWIEYDEEPPDSVIIEGQYGADDTFRLATDGDGNALGGIRLPHMVSTHSDGGRAGAPLGVYAGFDSDVWNLNPESGFAGLGGTFQPFPIDEIARRYPTRDAYVELVERAAAALLAQGFILEEDYHAYVRAAWREPLLERSP